MIRWKERSFGEELVVLVDKQFEFLELVGVFSLEAVLTFSFKQS